MEDTEGDKYYRHRITFKTAWFRPGEEFESVSCSETEDEGGNKVTKFYVNKLTGEATFVDPGKGEEGGGEGAEAEREDVWVKRVDRDGDAFYVNDLTLETRWELPKGAKVKAPQPLGGGGPQGAGQQKSAAQAGVKKENKPAGQKPAGFVKPNIPANRFGGASTKGIFPGK